MKWRKSCKRRSFWTTKCEKVYLPPPPRREQKKSRYILQDSQRAREVSVSPSMKRRSAKKKDTNDSWITCNPSPTSRTQIPSVPNVTQPIPSRTSTQRSLCQSFPTTLTQTQTTYSKLSLSSAQNWLTPNRKEEREKEGNDVRQGHKMIVRGSTVHTQQNELKLSLYSCRFFSLSN